MQEIQTRLVTQPIVQLQLYKGLLELRRILKTSKNSKHCLGKSTLFVDFKSAAVNSRLIPGRTEIISESPTGTWSY